MEDLAAKLVTVLSGHDLGVDRERGAGVAVTDLGLDVWEVITGGDEQADVGAAEGCGVTCTRMGASSRRSCSSLAEDRLDNAGEDVGAIATL